MYILAYEFCLDHSPLPSSVSSYKKYLTDNPKALRSEHYRSARFVGGYAGPAGSAKDAGGEEDWRAEREATEEGRVGRRKRKAHGGSWSRC